MTQSNKRLTETVKIRLKDKIIDLSIDDILKNNITKLTKEIPNLKISDSLSAQNPLKKIMTILESGPQNQYKYYRYLSFFIFLYIWVIQIAALYKGLAPAVYMLIITLWATYSIIRLNIKSNFKAPTLYDIIFDRLLNATNSSILYSLLAVSFIYSFYPLPNTYQAFSWHDIANAALMIKMGNEIYFEYVFIVGIPVMFLLCLYCINEIYEMYFFKRLLKHTTLGLLISSTIIVFVLFWFIPEATNLLFSDIVKDPVVVNKVVVVVSFCFGSISIFCMFFLTAMNFLFSILRSISKYIDKFFNNNKDVAP